MPSRWNKSAATLFERFVYAPPALVELQHVERTVKNKVDYCCRSHHFYSSTFQADFRINKLYFAYRWVICILCFMSCLFVSTDPSNSEQKTLNSYIKFPIYLSNIGLTLNWIQTLIGAVIITVGVKSFGFETAVPIDEEIKKHQLIYWKLQELSILAAVSVSATFWFVINPKNPGSAGLNNIFSHGINSVYALTDWLITGLPYNFTDIWVTIAYTLVYFLFTYIYWEAGGYGRLKPGESGSPSRIIYPKCTDWDRPQFALLCYFVCMSHTALLHVVLCALNTLRVKRMLKPPLTPQTTQPTTDSQLSTV